jgi:triphosphoribosyl-dephospho-CoA synthetase
VRSSCGLDPAEFAGALVAGARRELDLTPKPGLVDRRDCGSHPDLSHEAMGRSIDLLPIYYDELMLHAGPGSFDACIRAGQSAEARMIAAIGTNAHKGYIFLSGVALLAACQGPPDVAAFRSAIAATARRFFERVRSGGAHREAKLGRGGGEAPSRGGIREETLAGIPGVFEHGIPGYERRLRETADPILASFDLMARLMLCLDDTTAVHRCGPEGLATLRADGAQILRLLDRDEDPRPHLAALNEDYRRRNLTMGGVADCMALSFALLATQPRD